MKKIILLLVIVVLASPAFAETAAEIDAARARHIEDKITSSIINVKRATVNIDRVKWENKARTAQAEADFSIQKAELRGMCNLALELNKDVWHKLCNKN